MQSNPVRKRFHPAIAGVCLAAAFLFLAASEPAQAQTCTSWVEADVVALDQDWYWNRFGAREPQGQMYALAHDIVPTGHQGSGCYTVKTLPPGGVQLRSDKRARPLVLRINEGQCLRINFKNLLANSPVDDQQPATRAASAHVVGLNLVNTIRDDGSDAGSNGGAGDGIVNPGGSITYEYYAEKEGTYLMHSMGAVVSSEGDAGTISTGLFGAVTVEPAGSEWYRSQVTESVLSSVSTTGADGYPDIDYTDNASTRYTVGEDCLRAGLPKLRMLDSTGKIAHSDLTALVTGANGGNLQGYIPSSAVHPNRAEPFREFTIIFHDEIGALQAFHEFYDEKDLAWTLGSVADAFAINYGTGGIGAEILANRLKLGIVADCAECLYEEFFLSAWAVGDPSMIVDKPANWPCKTKSEIRNGTCTPAPGKKATIAFYPDDPSNVYHSYMNDHVKFRNLHAGSDDHHVFHLHAHQWTRTPRDPDSVYLDSQSIGQGSSFTYEIAYEGSGNRNKTVGDSIFHCHFYPHFAQGMWAMWRVHDVLELGTELDDKGRPASGSRALPDAEIVAGTPIPALVPMPKEPMAPRPAGAWIVAGNVVTEPLATMQARLTAGQDRSSPGYPFFVPGNPGHRPPHPPMDFAVISGQVQDGGLARHVGLAGGLVSQAQTRLDFHKHLQQFNAMALPEAGTGLEDLAMNFHAKSGFTTPTPTNAPTGGEVFELNGAPRKPGAPYADPCITDTGQPIPQSQTKHYEAAVIETGVTFNKAGWHFPQQRIITLIEDVNPTLAKTRPPEPFFFRANSNECIEFWHTNLVPAEYVVDDFQVRTPTDILGQHIHLVKFDVTSSDGGGNGFNYEDGTLSPEEVQTRIKAIRAANGCLSGETGGPFSAKWCPVAVPHWKFGSGPNNNCNEYQDFLGAQTTVQRWWADPTLTKTKGDQTLRTVFTHDHFGPSTHQQVGLYAGLIVEQAGSSYKHAETGTPLYTRYDGGPTSWQAVIEGPEIFREFMVEFGDFQHAYEDNKFAQSDAVCPDPVLGYSDPNTAVNPPGRKSHVEHKVFEVTDVCPLSGDPLPCPEGISADNVGSAVVNYRNEPVSLRVIDPENKDPVWGTFEQAPHATGMMQAGDLGFAYETRTDRAYKPMNAFPGNNHPQGIGPYSALTGGIVPGDPYTPVMRAFENDEVRVKVLTGAHEEEHNFTVHGQKWLAEPAADNSGWRNSQMTGISEFFEFELDHMPSHIPGRVLDYLYKPSAAAEWQWDGLWGLLRVYNSTVSPGHPKAPPPDSLVRLSDNPDGKAPDSATTGTYGTVEPGKLEPKPFAGANPDESATIEASRGEMTSTSAAAITTTTTQVPIACTVNSLATKKRSFDIVAVAAREVLPQNTLFFNWRDTTVVNLYDPAHPNDPNAGSPRVNSDQNRGPLHDPTAIMFVYLSDLDYTGFTGRPILKPNAPIEPLILRARAGDCIEVNLYNDLPKDPYDLDGWNAMPNTVRDFNANDVVPSLEVSLHPQLVFHDASVHDGSNAGLNPVQYKKQTVAPGEKISYYWFAGDIDTSQASAVVTPVEFGAVGLTSVDPIKHSNKSAVGTLIIEPQGSSWKTPDKDPYGPLPGGAIFTRRTRALATVTPQGGTPFREFVTIFQDDVNLRYWEGFKHHTWEPVMSMAVNEDSQETASKAFNYRTEPLWFRHGFKPESDPEETRNFTDFDEIFRNAYIGGTDPVTPIYTAAPGQPVRFRVVHPAGHTQNHTFTVHGHNWQFSPYVTTPQAAFPPVGSNVIGNNPLSEWVGALFGVGPTAHHNILLSHGAGGAMEVTGDYLYRDYVSWGVGNGLWGLLRVEDSGGIVGTAAPTPTQTLGGASK